MDQLRQILDGINIVMRRRRDESDARSRKTNFRDPRINFAAGQLAAFAGLRALRHLDLQFLRVDEVLARDAEAAGSDLLDGAVPGIAVGIVHVARGIFAAFAGVALAANAVHRDGERFVRFLADGAVGHRAGFEPLDDRFNRFDFLNGNAVCSQV